MTEILYLPATYQAGFVTISGAIWTRLGTNPGSTIAEVSAALSYTESVVSQALDILETQRIVVRRYDANGIPRYWKSSQYESLLISNIAGARTWLATHCGSTANDLAVALGVAYGLATGLAEALATEGSCKILYS
jgi:hypothetical protein